MVRLSKRLKAVTDLVTQGHAVVDVGCDHAYVPIFLLEQGRSPFASASDLRPGPLSSAKENIERAGLSDRIRVELCSGVPVNILQKMREAFGADGDPFECPLTLITAGMGGLLMKQIYEDAGNDLDDFSELIASPQRDADVFRADLRERGWRIADEHFLKEDGKYYPVIRAVRGLEAERSAGSPAVPCEDLFGPLLLSKRDPVLLEYLLRQRDLYEGILCSINKREEPEPEAQEKVRKHAALIGEALQYYS